MKNSPLKLVLLICLLLTSLILFNGCRMLGIRWGKQPIEWNCEVEIEENYGTKEDRDLAVELELLQKTFTMEKLPLIMNNRSVEDLYKIQNRFNKSFFKVKTPTNSEFKKIIFIAHKDNFEAEYQAFRKVLSSLEGTYKLYIYLETPNLLYVEKITGEIIYSKVTLSEISIHSNEPSWYYIKGKGTVKSVYLTGHHEIMGIEKSLTVENIYIHSTERLREFTCNMDSTSLFYTNGKIRDKNVFPNLFDKPSKLKKIEMLNTE